jgi:hypothetical protein
MQTTPGGPIFKVTKWNVVGSWAAGEPPKTCAICKNELCMKCNHCISMNDPNSICYVV